MYNYTTTGGQPSSYVHTSIKREKLSREKINGYYTIITGCPSLNTNANANKTSLWESSQTGEFSLKTSPLNGGYCGYNSPTSRALRSQRGARLSCQSGRDRLSAAWWRLDASALSAAVETARKHMHPTLPHVGRITHWQILFTIQ